ncbi:MAG: ATP-binding protein [Proteiniphilum sp.]
MIDLQINKTSEITQKNSIFRIGKVFSVDGLEIKIKVDKEKNSSHLLYKGELLKNISVGGYLKIAKGFTSIVAKVNGEYIKEEKYYNNEYNKEENKINRILIVQLLGYIENGQFEKGIKELPLIDNHCFLLDKAEFILVHKFIKNGEDTPIEIGTLAYERSQIIEVGINSLFASHIGIFGNTGSGKSYTLAQIYRQLFLKFKDSVNFKKNAKFVLIDFNGEYNQGKTIIPNKSVYNLNTRKKEGENKIPLSEKDLLDIELISIMASATDKTQKPFLDKVINQYKKISKKDNRESYFKKILKNKVVDVFSMTDKVKAHLLVDYLKAILLKEKTFEERLTDDIDWCDKENRGFFIKPISDNKYLKNNESNIIETDLYGAIDTYSFSDNFITNFIDIAYVILIQEVFNSRAQNEHIAPAISKLQIFQTDFDKVISTNKDDKSLFSESNFVVLNFDNVNIKIRKMLPLLVSHKIYKEHKEQNKKGDKSLNIIIDEAHNILSHSSQRESETWKDYRLETFEEIIKEGRKFGVFLTIASQRPSDISSTIISQLHNYFVHRLVNERDIEAMGKSISFLDKVSHEALPILPTGACVFTGIAAQIPAIIQINKIPKENEPDNKTINLVENWIDKNDDFDF